MKIFIVTCDRDYITEKMLGKILTGECLDATANFTVDDIEYTEKYGSDEENKSEKV